MKIEHVLVSHVNRHALKLQEPDMVEESCQYLPNFKAWKTSGCLFSVSGININISISNHLKRKKISIKVLIAKTVWKIHKGTIKRKFRHTFTKNKESTDNLFILWGRISHLYGALCTAKATNYNKAPV